MTFDWAGIVEREGAALGDAAGVDPTAPVPAAPGWDTTQLLRHVGLVHARTSVILRTGTMERPSRENGLLPQAPEDGLLDWYRATLIEPALAVDGIDEVFSVFVPTLGAGRSPGDSRTVHLHTTAAEGEWLVRFDEGDVPVETGHAKSDAAEALRELTTF